MKLVLLLTCFSGVLFGQSYPAGGQWWHQPIAREYGSEAHPPRELGDLDPEMSQNDAENQEYDDNEVSRPETRVVP